MKRVAVTVTLSITLTLLASMGGGWGDALGQTAGPPPTRLPAGSSSFPSYAPVAPPPASEYRPASSSASSPPSTPSGGVAAPPQPAGPDVSGTQPQLNQPALASTPVPQSISSPQQIPQPTRFVAATPIPDTADRVPQPTETRPQGQIQSNALPSDGAPSGQLSWAFGAVGAAVGIGIGIGLYRRPRK